MSIIMCQLSSLYHCHYIIDISLHIMYFLSLVHQRYQILISFLSSQLCSTACCINAFSRTNPSLHCSPEVGHVEPVSAVYSMSFISRSTSGYYKSNPLFLVGARAIYIYGSGWRYSRVM